MDLISRQAAIDAVCKACQYDREDYTDCPDRSPSSLFCDYMNAFRSLPSAQPEYYDYSDIDPLWNSFAEENDINLTDGAKQLKDAMWVGYRKGKEDAQPERTGKWELAIGYDPKRTVMCDNCHKMAYEPSAYCPNCGAKMEET